ncbi:MAG: DUF4430 domain-containing protein [Lachnospiraceae bacterium]|nr:DUF4430 domain-containing protein [Lachnospiraceae bacterium]
MKDLLEKIKEFFKNKKNIRVVVIVVVVVFTLVGIAFNTEISSPDSKNANGSSITEIDSDDGSGKSEKFSKNKNKDDDSEETGLEEKSDSKKSNNEGADSSKGGKSSGKNDSSKTGNSSGDGNSSSSNTTIENGNTSHSNSSGNGVSHSVQSANTQQGGGNNNTTRQAVTVNCTISIDCSSISGNGALTAAGNPQLEGYAANSWILAPTSITVTDTNGDGRVGVDEAIKQACDSRGIQYEFKGSSYLRGMNYLYEFNAGPNSGWMYKVNGRIPNKGCNTYYLEGSENVEWYYVISY